jgi:hypothetical protein
MVLYEIVKFVVNRRFVREGRRLEAPKVSGS